MKHAKNYYMLLCWIKLGAVWLPSRLTNFVELSWLGYNATLYLAFSFFAFSFNLSSFKSLENNTSNQFSFSCFKIVFTKEVIFKKKIWEYLIWKTLHGQYNNKKVIYLFILKYKLTIKIPEHCVKSVKS